MNPKKPDVIIIGAGAHGRVLLDLLRQSNAAVRGAVDMNAELHGTKVDGILVIGGMDAVFSRRAEDVVLVNAVGNYPGRGATDLDNRRKIFETYSDRGYAFISVISAQAHISSGAELRTGCQIITGAIIQTGAVVGRNALINTGARVDHDCKIGDHSHIAPGAVLCGRVVVEDECHVGAGAVVVQRIRIGKGATVGAGAVVLKDVAPGTTVVGSPARQTSPPSPPS